MDWLSSLSGETTAAGSAKRDTDNPHAYESYLRGRVFSLQLKRESILKAIGDLDDGIRRRSRYARAQAGLANCYNSLPITRTFHQVMPSRKRDRQRPRRHQTRSAIADAHAVLGWVALWHEWVWTDAEQAWSALWLTWIVPATSGMGTFCPILGLHESAARSRCRLARRSRVRVWRGPESALRVPGPPLRHRGGGHPACSGTRATLLGRTDHAREDPGEQRAVYEPAIRSFKNATEGSGASSEGIALAGYTYGVSGRPGEARERLRELETIAQTRVRPSVCTARSCIRDLETQTRRCGGSNGPTMSVTCTWSFSASTRNGTRCARTLVSYAS